MTVQKPLDPFSEVVDTNRRWNPEWYSWLTGVIADVAGGGWSTGDLRITHKAAADPGWILWQNEGTIGNGSSGSSVRANADTRELFTIYYDFYSTSLFTSAGVATTRAAQGTALVAFNNGCRINLPPGPGRALGIAGFGTGLSPRPLGGGVGAETVTMTAAQMPVHNHTATTNSHSHSAQTTGPHTHGHTWTMPTGEANAPLAQTAAGFNNMEFQGINAVTGTDVVIHANDIGIIVNAVGNIGVNVDSAGSGQAMNVMNPTTYINIMIKL